MELKTEILRYNLLREHRMYELSFYNIILAILSGYVIMHGGLIALDCKSEGSR